MISLVTGVMGQDGIYLSELLRKQDHKIIGISKTQADIPCDLTNLQEVINLIKTYTPDYIFHFAANSSTRHDVILDNYNTISTGTLNILESVRLHSPGTKIFIPGSGLQFVNHGIPIAETNEFEARDAYSMCRIQSVYAARYYRLLGIQVYIGYLFNHDSPYRTENHMTKKISMAALRISNGSNENLEIGDLTAIKEYSFAGDIVKGIWTLVNQENIFEANISSGVGYSIIDWLDICFSLKGIEWEKYVKVNPQYKPPYHTLVSDPTRIFSLGWKPEISFKQLAEMMVVQ